MSSRVYVVGHKNPDNDAISAAVGYAYLKNELEKRRCGDPDPEFEYIPARLGPLPPESEWVLRENGFEEPLFLENVRTRVKDAMTCDPISVMRDEPLAEAGRHLRKNNIRSLVVTNCDGTYYGLVTSRMIAAHYLSAMDVSEGDIQDEQAVGSALVASLKSPVGDLAETDVLTLDMADFLKETTPRLLESSLRAAAVLDEDGKAVGIITRTDVANPPKRKVILVDHNEQRQAVDGIEEAEVLEIIDHHRIADVSTANPIQFINMPVGSSATIVTMEFRRHGMEVPKPVAAVLLSAVLTDTVILKSPTTTDTDKEIVDYLAGIIDVDPVEYGMQVFKCRTGLGDVPVEKIVGADSKEFEVGDGVVLIAQHETVDLEGVLNRLDEIRAHMNKLRTENGYDFVLLMATDIIAEGSQLICEGNDEIVNKAFDICCVPEGVWMPGVLSRKKQVAAPILSA